MNKAVVFYWSTIFRKIQGVSVGSRESMLLYSPLPRPVTIGLKVSVGYKTLSLYGKRWVNMKYNIQGSFILHSLRTIKHVILYVWDCMHKKERLIMVHW